MKAIYVLWSNRDQDKVMTDYSAITGILSMLYWKKNNGPIKVYLDGNTANFFEKSGIFDLNLIDEVDTKLLTSDLAKKITVKDSLWTWADIFAISDLSEDAVFLDWDNIFKQKYLPDRNVDLTYAHREMTVYPYYPHPITHINDYENSEFSNLDWNFYYTNNVSFLHFNNLELADKFSYYAMKYITDPTQQVKRNYDYLNVRILFVIQYLLTAVAQKYKKNYIFNDIFDPKNNLWFHESNEKSNRNDNIMYHLWIYKKILHTDNSEYEMYMSNLFNQIKYFFPEYLENIIKILYPLSKWKTWRTTKEYDFFYIRPTNYNTGEVIKYI